MKTHEAFFPCDCGYGDHLASVRWREGDDDGIEMVYLTMLVNKGNLFYRVLTAIRYILNMDNSYGLWHEILLNPRGVIRLSRMLSSFTDHYGHSKTATVGSTIQYTNHEAFDHGD